MGINERKDKGHNLSLFLINKRPRLCVVSRELRCKLPLVCGEQCTPAAQDRDIFSPGGLCPSPKQRKI